MQSLNAFPLQITACFSDLPNSKRTFAQCVSLSLASRGVRTVWPAPGYTEINMIPVKANAFTPHTQNSTQQQTSWLGDSYQLWEADAAEESQAQGWARHPSGSRPAKAPFPACLHMVYSGTVCRMERWPSTPQRHGIQTGVP